MEFYTDIAYTLHTFWVYMYIDVCVYKYMQVYVYYFDLFIYFLFFSNLNICIYI